MDYGGSTVAVAGRGSGSDPHGDEPKDPLDLYGGQEDVMYNGHEGEDQGVSAAMNIEAALNQVKDQVVTLADSALKSIAEALAGIGISPTVLGYSEEDFMYSEEGESSQRRVHRDQVIQKTSFARRSEVNMSRRKAEDEAPGSGDEVEPAVPEEGQGASWQGAAAADDTYEDKKDK
jgi:hypothetical protein